MILNLTDRLKNGLPVLTWSKTYTFEKAIADLVAGITIGLTLIPQCIAYASLAGLGPQYGLYSSLFGGIIYVTFGTIPELNIAPTALVSLLTFTFTHSVTYGNAQAAILLCFLSGIIELICGGLHLGFLVDFVSTPVVAAFTSAGALTIASSQVKNLLGLKFSAESFSSVWSNVFWHITETKKWDAILGFSCCVVLLLMRKLKDFGAPPLEDSKSAKTTSPVKKLIWFCSVARNAFVVVICALGAYLLAEKVPFSLTSQVPEGLPSFVNPVAEAHNGNATVSVMNMMKELGSGIIVVPFVAILGNVAIAKAFSKGKIMDASQEMIAVGMCNLIGSLFGSYPISASFSRAALSNASGVKTPLAGIYTSGMVLLALTFLTPYFSYIPKATLAAVIICAVIFMVEVTLMKMIWEISKMDLVPFYITLLSCLLLSIEIGILVGVGIDILFLLYTAARPKILIEKTNGHLRITPTSAILFPSAEHIRDKILKNKELQSGGYTVVVFDCQRINKMDFTGAKCLSACISDLKKMKKEVVFYRPKKPVAKMVLKVTEGEAKVAETEESLRNFLRGGSTDNVFDVLDDISATARDVEINIDKNTTQL